MSKHITIKQITKATDLSRTTVYRKLNAGATKEELLNSVPGLQSGIEQPPVDIEQPPVDNNMDPDDKAALTWCRAVLWAADHMHDDDMTVEKAGNKLRFSMWQSAQKYSKELLIQLVPKALQILDRNRDDGSTVEANAAERKSVQELKELLAGAIEESKSVTHEG